MIIIQNISKYKIQFISNKKHIKIQNILKQTYQNTKYIKIQSISRYNTHQNTKHIKIQNISKYKIYQDTKHIQQNISKYKTYHENVTKLLYYYVIILNALWFEMF